MLLVEQPDRSKGVARQQAQQPAVALEELVEDRTVRSGRRGRRAKEDSLIVPLNRRNPFEKPMLAAPMAYGRRTSGPWPKVPDALFCIREMSASRPMER